MITISRSLLRQVRSVFRRAGIGKAPSGPGSHVQVEAYSDGLRLRGMTFDAAVEYHQPSRLTAEQFILPVQFLDDCEGRKDEPVTLEASGKNRVTASFTDGGVPQLIDYQVEPANAFAGFPHMPESIDANEPRLLAALREALDATDRESTRYALGNIQLRGQVGRIVATDGHQVYRQDGFSFPWTGDLLMPGSNVLKSSEFPQDQQVGIGQAGDWVMLMVGFWIVWLKIDKDGRFPSVESIMPNVAKSTTRLELDPTDAEFLRRGLARLPDSDDLHHPVTIDLNGRVAIRAKSGASPHATELVLSRSRLEGELVTICTNRRFLERAAAMGFRQMAVFVPEKPVLCDDGQRQYLWCLLDPKEAIPPDDQAVRVESMSASGANGHTSPAAPTPQSTNPRSTNTPMGTTNGNGQEGQTRPRRRTSSTPASASQTNGHDSGTSPIQQAEDLHASLRDTLHRTRDLIASLRRQKKQSRLVATTLASLKQLQGVAE